MQRRKKTETTNFINYAVHRLFLSSYELPLGDVQMNCAGAGETRLQSGQYSL